jgi:sialidase-1
VRHGSDGGWASLAAWKSIIAREVAMKRHLLAAFAVCLALASASRAAPLFENTDVYVSGKEGYNTFRIPAIELAADGTLLAFAEARKYNSSDPGFPNQDIDLVLKRSTDGGKTWSPMTVIEDPGELWSAANPATVVDRQTGRVWLFYIRSKPGKSSRTAEPGTDDMILLARTSDDNGRTWSQPIDVDRVARDRADAKWRATVVGPGGMIQDRNGRLIAPAWRAGGEGVFTIFSDDHGRTWQRGSSVPGDKYGNEDQLVELADGRILIDYRQAKAPHRWMATSGDGGRTWSEPRPGVTVTPVACAIERYTLKSAGDDRDRILWTGPKGPGRRNLVVRVSYDEGLTFPVERPIAEGTACYSDLAILKDKTVGLLWERGVTRNCEFITFTRFDREFLEPKTAKSDKAAEPVLLVTNKHEDTLSLVDPRTLKTMAKVPAGHDPHELLITPDQRFAYLSNYAPPGNTVSVIDLAKKKLVRQIETDPYTRIHGAAMSPDGKRAYFTAGQSGVVVEIDTQAQRLVRAIATHGRISHMVVVAPDGQRLYTGYIT